MATSPEEMYGGHQLRVPGLGECLVPGCFEPAVFWPYKNPNVRFCQRHADRLIAATVAKVLEEVVREEPL